MRQKASVQRFFEDEIIWWVAADCQLRRSKDSLPRPWFRALARFHQARATMVAKADPVRDPPRRVLREGCGLCRRNP